MGLRNSLKRSVVRTLRLTPSDLPIGHRPVSEHWGFDRGGAIDRCYIEAYLRRHAHDIRGRVLEVKNSDYTRRFGRAVTHADVIDIDPGNKHATVVTDLTAPEIPDETYDCLLLTQTLQYIYDLGGTLRHMRRILRPGGVLLATFPLFSKIDTETGIDDYWRFTPALSRRLFGETFGDAQVTVTPMGNYRSSLAYLIGYGQQDLQPQEFHAVDPSFPLVIGVRAVRGDHSAPLQGAIGRIAG